MSATELHYPFRDSQGTLHFLTEGDASERVTLELASAYTRAPSAATLLLVAICIFGMIATAVTLILTLTQE